MKYDVISIGSATRDLFFTSSALSEGKDPSFSTGKGACFPLGSKLDMDMFMEEAGGGAVNTAVTFANLGLHAGALAVIGADEAGIRIRRELQEAGAGVDFLLEKQGEYTPTSVIISAGKAGRSIFRHKGASGSLHEFQVPWEELDAKWVYINHLRDEDAALAWEAVRRASSKGISVAMNPGSSQLERKEELKSVLDMIDLFILNQEEAAGLTGVPYEEKDKIFEVLDEWVKGIVVMTRGPKGVEVSDGTTRWSAGILPMEEIVDRTGAGDAFGSGFLSSLIRHPGNIEEAIQLGSANATGVLREWGSTKGLLKKTESPLTWGKLSITQQTLSYESS